MRRATAFLIAALLAPGAAMAAAPPAAGSAELIERAAAWNGRIVAFSGEAVGDVMVRGEGAWLHLNDDAYRDRGDAEGAARGGYNSGQAVWAPAELARRVRFLGGYHHAGDAVLVTGTFHAACREHGGDMDIHAVALEVLRAGHPVAHRPNLGRLGLAVALLALAGALALLRSRAARRRM